MKYDVKASYYLLISTLVCVKMLHGTNVEFLCPFWDKM